MNNQLEERKYYEEDEIDLLDLVRTVMQHKGLIVITTIIFMVVSLFGGYFYNKSKAVTTAVLTLDYPGREKGLTPDGGILTSDSILPLEAFQSVYEEYKDQIKSKDFKEFVKNNQLVWMVPDYIQKRIKDAANRGEKYEYTPIDFQINSKENTKVVGALANDALESFLNKYRPNYVIDPISIKKDYDYPVVYQLIDDKIEALKVLIADREEKKFISNKSGFSFDKIMQNIASLEKIELQDYYSYYTVHQLSLDSKTRDLRFKSDIQVLKMQRDALKSQAAVLKSMIDEYKPSEKSFVLANVGELDKKVTQGDAYYGKMLDEYFALNKEIIAKESTISRLTEESKLTLTYPTEEQQKAINEKLDILVNKLNKIIDEVNQLNDEYTRVTYSNMISISSPVITTTTGKPLYMYLVVGLVLGGCFGIFLAFASEFKKDYKKRYSK
ncbi:hypothetical protein IX317_000568 [Fusobacterium sp. DD29]|uniref:Wzz/FepE/Etk N-terminal domain-containing protein n=1 Tax=unclassified Fusobacterium TaxID=2648384 RepID=UPI001B8AF5F4|nr:MULTISPECIES: Wzz/FepE/Etk N-terminal domain-containing protein [unclassified Fusobacterium]MBR8748907.1 hypothetical protein [Fusobacterium sp. DD29]MBR8761191.1 hypothetical protein [Fusobacterium sp. DD25]MBR8767203.1 hypothetical protein [Fusobacterium sp. DD43]MBR8771253.1 hypothetical protein [Fusobacterium sp. DD40]MBR8775462.1 hypothetical protein [Fusobacterium sp. DD17]